MCLRFAYCLIPSLQLLIPLVFRQYILTKTVIVHTAYCIGSISYSCFVVFDDDYMIIHEQLDTSVFPIRTIVLGKKYLEMMSTQIFCV